MHEVEAITKAIAERPINSQMAGVLHTTASSFLHCILGALKGHSRVSSEAPSLLHGVLDITVYEANHLDSFIEGLLIQTTESVQKLLHDKLAHTRLFATVDLGEATVARTRIAEFQAINPKWNQSFRGVYCAHSSSSVVISVRNQLDLVLSPVLGRAAIPASQLLNGKPVQGWFDLFHEDGLRVHKARVHVALKYTPAAADPSWGAGVTPAYGGLANAFFPLRTGCHVTLYHDAHHSNHFHPAIQLGNGEQYRTSRLWEELYSAISDAKHFIYVTGWSVNVHIKLVREPDRIIPGAESVTLGELLKRKAEEGVTVLVMPWNDRTSLPLLEDVGAHLLDVMKTHDEETFKFFKHTKVKCFRCSRKADESLTLLQSEELKLLFSHHQKTVSLDASAGDGTRKVVSFVGGIDLCQGRYDDENHTLFKNLYTTHLNDFLQGNFDNADLDHGGPREPWHDIHSKLEGKAAWDVVTNFEQRWLKQSPKELTNFLVNIRERPQIFPIPSDDETEGSWNVQVFRSIDNASAVGFPNDPVEAGKRGLMSDRNVTFEQSIHSGYIEAIRRAQRFIYIENQYFFGSCASWRRDQNCGCTNLVPIEIALKIADKIRRGERFAAYIVTPMWPEGEPEGNTVQGILHWYRLTMEMMYGVVAEAIEEKRLTGKVHPCDYLNFFCLGNREAKQPGELTPPQAPERGTDYSRAQSNRRFPVYVHSKLMIVDDEYVIVGSANLNQRSLAGDRDSEIAHGSYQPAHLNASDGRARGDVYGFRMSLWYEHFMNYWPDKAVFLDAGSLDCVKAVRRCAEDFWSKYVGDEVADLPGHLLPFPIHVSWSGKVSDLPDNGLFPDTKAPVKGKRWALALTNPIPTQVTDLLTT